MPASAGSICRARSLQAAGIIDDRSGRGRSRNPAIGEACAAIVALAQAEFASARAIMAQSPRRMVRAPRIMGEAYRLILDGLVARGFAAPRARVRLPKAKFLFIVLRNLL